MRLLEHSAMNLLEHYAKPCPRLNISSNEMGNTESLKTSD